MSENERRQAKQDYNGRVEGGANGAEVQVGIIINNNASVFHIN